MSRLLYGNLDLVLNQLLNARLQMLGSDPSPLEAQVYYNSTTHEIRYHDGTSWKALGASGAGGPPSGTAGGDLSGSYPNPQIAAGVIVDADVNASAAIAQTKISGLAASLTAKQDTSAKGVANGYAPLDGSNLIPTTHLPPLAINDVFTVASEAAMLALTAQVGDMAIRTDTGKTYVLAASPASTLVNWKEVMAAGAVQSVNGQTGVVSITTTTLGAVPTTRQVIAGSGLTGGGALTGDVTLSSGIKSMWGALGSTSPKVITHNMNTRDVFVRVYRDGTPYEEIDVEVEHTTADTITLRFNPSPAGLWRVMILGF